MRKNAISSRGKPRSCGASAPRWMSLAEATENSAAHNTFEPDQKHSSGRPVSMASIVAILSDAARQFEPFEIDEQIDRDADRAQREPGEIERDVKEEQRQFDAPRTGAAVSQRHEIAKQTSDAATASAI